ncbi:MAG: PHP domain-containing protein [Tannerellaceae bacterium]|jgi:predicted metal-dependent phosphoesterase TrpH|nr:PHP domain-containing protein [Tannerellaceae bacterium]
MEINIPASAIHSDTASPKCLTEDAIRKKGARTIKNYGMTAIHAPAWTATVERAAFKPCIKLKDVRLNRNIPLRKRRFMFADINPEDVAIHAPSGSQSANHAGKLWRQFGRIVKPEPRTSRSGSHPSTKKPCLALTLITIFAELITHNLNKSKMKKNLFLLLSLVTLSCYGQLRNADIYKIPEMEHGNIRSEIQIPDIDGFHTMKCDLHSHTVFSDGHVWPDVRTREAWQQGLDAIAITDHIEYRPRKSQLTGDHNEAYKIARKKGEELGIIVIHGTEITRNKPFGHMNALFITDANPLAITDSIAAIDIAIAQGGFIQWNHPGWPDNKSTLYPLHEQLIKDKKIHAVEVFNYNEYYPVAFNWCKTMNLAFTANSDIHELVTEIYGTDIRPMTLVFASERTEAGIKEALFAGRSVAFFNGHLAGRAEHLRALVKASIRMKVLNAEKNQVEIVNLSDIPYTFSSGGSQFSISGSQTIRATLPKTKMASVRNCFTGMDEYLTIDYSELKVAD